MGHVTEFPVCAILGNTPVVGGGQKTICASGVEFSKVETISVSSRNITDFHHAFQTCYNHPT